tara:strand:+ start:964 stop:1896 length:933 start_codon:yes stop_codon:yes gene_type:complete
MQIVSAKKFKCEQVKYKPAVTNQRGGKDVKVQLNGSNLVLQVPLMLTWGLNERDNDGRMSYDLALQFEPHKYPAQQKALDNIKSFENKILNDSVTNGKSWFGKSKLSRDAAEVMMWPILKYPKNKDTGELDYDRNPTMKLKVPFWDGNFTVELYNMDGQVQYRPIKEGQWNAEQNTGTPMTLMPKGTHLTGLIQCTGLWFAGGKFGCTWKLLQAKLQQPVRLVGSGVCHIVEDSDDEDTLAELKAKQEEKEAFVQKDDQYTTEDVPTFGGESEASEDEEEEEEAEAEPEPVKKKVIKKKRVVKKKKNNNE